MKPFTLDFLKVFKGIGVNKVLTMDDLNFLPNNRFIKNNKIPKSILKFKEWLFNSNEIDFLNDWPE